MGSDARRAEKFEKHRKEIMRRAWLNVFLLLGMAIGGGIYLGGFVPRFLGIFVGYGAAVGIVITLTVIVVVGTQVPLLHFREEYTLASDKSPGYYRSRSLEAWPVVELLEGEGWEEVECGEDKITLSTYPTFLHRWMGRESTIEFEVQERGDDTWIATVTSNGKELEKVKSSVEEAESGSILYEEGVSLRRVSPAFLELTLFILPQMQDFIRDIAEEEIRILDENIEYGLSQYSLSASE